MLSRWSQICSRCASHCNASPKRGRQSSIAESLDSPLHFAVISTTCTMFRFPSIPAIPKGKCPGASLLCLLSLLTLCKLFILGGEHSQGCDGRTSLQSFGQTVRGIFSSPKDNSNDIPHSTHSSVAEAASAENSRAYQSAVFALNQERVVRQTDDGHSLCTVKSTRVGNSRVLTKTL